MGGKKQNINPIWKILMKDVDLGEPTSLTMLIWVALNENIGVARILWIIVEVCSNRGFLLGLWKNTRNKSYGKNLMPKRYLHGPYEMEGHAKKCVERYCGTGEQNDLNNYAKSQLHVLTTINSKKKK